MITVVDMKGRMRLQNPESCARLGCHAASVLADEVGGDCDAISPRFTNAQRVLLSTGTGSTGGLSRGESVLGSSGATRAPQPTAMNYLAELFHGQEVRDGVNVWHALFALLSGPELRGG
jgi:hypothetical protein